MADETYLLSAADIAAMEPVAKVHFLNPAARRTNRSLGDATGLSDFGIHLVEVRPGDASTEAHLHHHEDEAVYVLSGTATATIGEREHRIGPGDFIGYRKGGLAHTILNDGAEVLRLLVVGTRAPVDLCDYPRAGKRLIRSAPLPQAIVALDAIAPVGPDVGRK